MWNGGKERKGRALDFRWNPVAKNYYLFSLRGTTTCEKGVTETRQMRKKPSPNSNSTKAGYAQTQKKMNGSVRMWASEKRFCGGARVLLGNSQVDMQRIDCQKIFLFPSIPCMDMAMAQDSYSYLSIHASGSLGTNQDPSGE